MRRKGTPCACESDPCGSSKGKCIRAINNVSPDPNGDLELKAGNGIAISQSGDNQITVINDATASSFVAGDNIEINPSGDDLEIRLTDNPVINGTLQVRTGAGSGIKNPNSIRNTPNVLNFYDVYFNDKNGDTAFILRCQDNADGIRQVNIGFWVASSQAFVWHNIASQNCL